MGSSIGRGWLGIVTIVGVLAPIGCSSVDAAEKVGEDQSMLTEGACISEALGGETSCKSLETWKEYANDACQNRGLGLAELSPGRECNGGFSEVKYACCKAGPKPLPPKPDQPDQAACFADAMGGPTSCKEADVWTKYASEMCAEKGSSISQIAFSEECGKGAFRWSKYVCCEANKPPPPPPAPPRCITTALDVKDACTDPTVKEHAFDLCRARGLRLSDLAIDGRCEEGGGPAKVTCCSLEQDEPRPPQPTDPLPAKPTDPAPPQPAKCFTKEVKADGCLDRDSLRKLASESCAQDNAAATAFAEALDCANGGSSFAKIECCL